MNTLELLWAIRDDTSITDGVEKAVLMAYALRGEIPVSLSQLASDAGFGRSTVQRARQRLLDEGRLVEVGKTGLMSVCRVAIQPARSGMDPSRSGMDPSRSGMVAAPVQPARSGMDPSRSGMDPSRSGHQRATVDPPPRGSRETDPLLEIAPWLADHDWPPAIPTEAVLRMVGDIDRAISGKSRTPTAGIAAPILDCWRGDNHPPPDDFAAQVAVVAERCRESDDSAFAWVRDCHGKDRSRSARLILKPQHWQGFVDALGRDPPGDEHTRPPSIAELEARAAQEAR